MKQKKLQFDKVASFDSELMLLFKYQYDLNMWIPNPFYLEFKYQQLNTDKSEVLMTSRLDGPSADLVKRIINDGIKITDASNFARP